MSPDPSAPECRTRARSTGRRPCTGRNCRRRRSASLIGSGPSDGLSRNSVFSEPQRLQTIFGLLFIRLFSLRGRFGIQQPGAVPKAAAPRMQLRFADVVISSSTPPSAGLPDAARRPRCARAHPAAALAFRRKKGKDRGKNSPFCLMAGRPSSRHKAGSPDCPFSPSCVTTA